MSIHFVLLQLYTKIKSVNNKMYCYCIGKVHWQEGNINKKVNNVLLLLLLWQN